MEGFEQCDLRIYDRYWDDGPKTLVSERVKMSLDYNIKIKTVFWMSLSPKMGPDYTIKTGFYLECPHSLSLNCQYVLMQLRWVLIKTAEAGFDFWSNTGKIALTKPL